jgi:beta-glucosidase
VAVTFDVPTQRLAFTDRSMTRVVEPGDVEVWVASHSAASALAETEEATGGAIRNEKAAQRRQLPGTATPRERVVLSGDVHRVAIGDRRLVTSQVRRRVATS